MRGDPYKDWLIATAREASAATWSAFGGTFIALMICQHWIPEYQDINLLLLYENGNPNIPSSGLFRKKLMNLWSSLHTVNVF